MFCALSGIFFSFGRALIEFLFQNIAVFIYSLQFPAGQPLMSLVMPWLCIPVCVASLVKLNFAVIGGDFFKKQKGKKEQGTGGEEIPPQY